MIFGDADLVPISGKFIETHLQVLLLRTMTSTTTSLKVFIVLIQILLILFLFQPASPFKEPMLQIQVQQLLSVQQVISCVDGRETVGMAISSVAVPHTTIVFKYDIDKMYKF